MPPPTFNKKSLYEYVSQSEFFQVSGKSRSQGLSSQRLCVAAWSSWVCGHPAGRTEGTASPWRFRWRCRCATLFLRCRRRSGPLRSLSRSPYVWARCRQAGVTLAWCRHRSVSCCATAPSSPASGPWGSGRYAWTRRWSFQCASSRCWLCLPPSSGGHGCSPPSPARRARCRIAGCCEAGRTLSGPPGPHAGRLTAAARGGWSSGPGSHQLIGKTGTDEFLVLWARCRLFLCPICDEDKTWTVEFTCCAANPAPNWKQRHQDIMLNWWWVNTGNIYRTWSEPVISGGCRTNRKKGRWLAQAAVDPKHPESTAA